MNNLYYLYSVIVFFKIIMQSILALSYFSFSFWLLFSKNVKLFSFDHFNFNENQYVLEKYLLFAILRSINN